LERPATPSLGILWGLTSGDVNENENSPVAYRATLSDDRTVS
jgi:hypothetical protein